MPQPTLHAAAESEIAGLRSEIRALRDELKSSSNSAPGQVQNQSHDVVGASPPKVTDFNERLSPATAPPANRKAESSQPSKSTTQKRLRRSPPLALNTQPGAIAPNAPLPDDPPAQRRSETAGNQLYLSGQDLLFKREYDQAVDALTGAISHNPRDARFYYFRGLAYARLGNRASAEKDFKAGGNVEGSRSSEVSRALERIQGASGWVERAWLETFRP